MANPYIGEIRLFAGTFAPVGWLPCDGSVLPISTYEELYALIGTTYGGDGVQSFNVPDLRGRVPIHQGQRPSLSNRIMGETAGTESHTLQVSELPSHSHPMVIASTPATVTTSPAGNLLAPCNRNYSAPGTVPNVSLAATSVTSTGGGQQHENRMPLLAVTFIIAYQGVFPSQG